MSNLMPPGWTAHQTPEGKWYFHHQPSNVTQWHAPAPQGARPGHHGTQWQHQSQQQQASSAHQGHHGHHKQQHTMSAAAQRFVYQHPVEFKLKEKAFSLSGDNFSIKNIQTGESTFKVKGNAFSFKDSKALYDMNGNAIYKMSESIISLRGRMKIEDPSTKRTVITLRKKGIIPILGTSTIQAWRGDSDDGEPYMECKGNFIRKDFAIKEVATGRVLASVKRKPFTISNFLLEKDTYVIRIEPGTDVALLVFFVIAIDEQYRDDGASSGIF